MKRHINEYLTSWSELQKLATDNVREDQSLEFKEGAYLHPSKPKEKQDSDKYELRRDAAAMANAGGGIILVGVAEGPKRDAADRVPGIDRAGQHEGQVRDVLTRFVEPPFGDALAVHTIHDPDDAGRGVVVIRVRACDPGLPFAVMRPKDLPPEFWTRTDSKKQLAGYLQLRALFRAGEVGAVDAMALVKVKEIKHAIRDAQWDFGKMLEHLERVRPYIDDHDFSFHVRAEIVEAAGEVIHYPQVGLPQKAARAAINVLMNALPWPGELSEPQLGLDAKALLHLAASYAFNLVYDGAIKMDSLPIVGVGGEFFHQLLRLVLQAGHADGEREVRSELERAKEVARERGTDDAVRLLEFFESDAQAWRSGDARPEMPKGLEWVVLGKDEPTPHRPRRGGTRRR